MFFLKNNKKKLKFVEHQPTQTTDRNHDKNIDYIFKNLSESNDFSKKEITFPNKKGYLIYLETMVDRKDIEESLISPLKKKQESESIEAIIPNVDLTVTSHLNEVINLLLQGNCALFINGEEKVYTAKVPQSSSREPVEPTIERSVRGSHQGFVESLDKNLNLVRLRIENKNLSFKYYSIGSESQKNTAIIYLNDIANDQLVTDIEEKLKKISLDSLFSPGFIEEAIEMHPFSPFPQNLYTERPDRLEAHLMEGRVAILAEGSTNAIILPVTFFSFFQSIDDFNERIYTATVFRLLRMFSFLGALLFPPLYVAIVGFHFEIIPFEMISLVKNSISTVPFPPVIEALLMAVTIELIREAGIRLPSPIGETIGIVGGLIIGEAVVNAGIVSNVVVIVIALTAIMSFTNPSYEMGNVVRVLTFPLMIAATMFGFFGIVICIILILMHLSKLESFGTPYLAPLSPLHLSGLQDTFVRLPIWMLKKRPKELNPKDKTRLENDKGAPNS